MNAMGRDLKAFTRTTFAFAADSILAASPGSGDAVAISGDTIDRRSYMKAESVVFEIPCQAVLTEAYTLVVTAKVQYSANDSDWTDLADAATILTLTGTSGGSTEDGVGRIGADLTLCGRYIRVVATGDLNNTATDTATIGAAVAVFGGLQEAPQTS